MIEDLHHLAGKSAHRKLRRALHEKHDVVCLHFIVDELLDTHGFHPVGRLGRRDHRYMYQKSYRQPKAGDPIQPFLGA
jgi:hypothetical protein